MPNSYDNTHNLKSGTAKTSIDKEDGQFLARTGLTGAMGGLGIGGVLSLLYMLAEASKDRSRAEFKRKEVENLSPYLPTTAVPKWKKESSNGVGDSATLLEDTKSASLSTTVDDITGSVGDVFRSAGRGMWAYPAAATAVGIPAWLAFKFLKDRHTASSADQLERELEVAREEFREALRGTSKLSADIDSVIDDHKNTKKANFDPRTFWEIDKSKGSDEPPKDVFTGILGGYPGIAGGAISATGLTTAYLLYRWLDGRYSRGNSKIQAIRAMKDLQRRRKALSGISSTVDIKQDPEGRLYPSI